MFWPFTKWATAPAPYDSRATSWPVPVGLRTLPWQLLQSGSYPKRMGAVREGITSVGTEVPGYFLPAKASLAKTGVATSGALAMSQSARHIANLSRTALEKHSRGLVLSYEEAQALLQYRMPGPMGPVRPGGGVYDVPNNPAAMAPTSSAQVIAKLLPPGVALGRGDGKARVDQVVARVRSAQVMPPVAQAMMRRR